MALPSPVDGLEPAAAAILQRAIELDMEMRYTESSLCYMEGTQFLLNKLKSETNPKSKIYMRSKVQSYLDRIEMLKKYIEDEKPILNHHEEIVVENGSTGHGYKTVFGRFLDSNVAEVKVEDPYVRSFHQCQNFLRFCELLVTSCPNLKHISLLTSSDSQARDQMQSLESIKTSLLKYKIQLSINLSTTLHDRQVKISNGWVVKIGRGLDYFKAPDGKFSLGMFDLDLRPCHETTIHVFRAKDVKKSYG